VRRPNHPPDSYKTKVIPVSKISIDEVRRRLPVNAEFTCDYIGPNTAMIGPDNTGVRRRVIRQTDKEMTSVVLTGPRNGREVDCVWAWVLAEDNDGVIVLSNNSGISFVAISNITLPLVTRTLAADDSLR